MNQRVDFIIPECYVDTNLVETLVCHAGCNHQKGCNQVTKVMREKFADRFAVGIIDADKKRPGYIEEFHSFASSEHLELFHHSVRPHFIILVNPAIDGFILSCAKSCGINMEDFSLSSKLKEFTKQTKDVMSNKDARFKSLFRAMEESDELKLMKSIIQYFIGNTYQTKEEDIQQLLQGSF